MINFSDGQMLRLMRKHWGSRLQGFALTWMVLVFTAAVSIYVWWQLVLLEQSHGGH
ncbi:MAG: hypothetical protein JSS27_20410 [Planctomycetes bacterium]|nr:hypothetical protein [Planctomycetota bacterium]